MNRSDLDYLDQRYSTTRLFEPQDPDTIVAPETDPLRPRGLGIPDRPETIDLEGLPSRGVVSDFLSAAAAGGLDVGELAGHATQTMGAIGGSEFLESMGQKMVDFVGKTAKKHPDLFLPSKESIEAQPGEEGKGLGGFRHWSYGGVRAATTSLGASLPGGVAGAAVGGPWGAVAGFALSGGALFGLAEYNKFMEDGREAGIPDEVLKNKAVISAFVEGGFEGLANALEAGVFKFMRPATRGVLASLAKNRIKKTAVDLARRLAITMPVEVGTEVTQEFLEAKLRQDVGIPTVEPIIAAKSAVGPAAVVTLLFGVGSINLADAKRRKIANTLANVELTPDERMEAANQIEAELNRQDRSGETGSQWHDLVDEMIVDGDPVVLDDEILRLDKIQEEMEKFREPQERDLLEPGEVIPAPGEAEEIVAPAPGEELLPEGQVIPAPVEVEAEVPEPAPEEAIEEPVVLEPVEPVEPKVPSLPEVVEPEAEVPVEEPVEEPAAPIEPEEPAGPTVEETLEQEKQERITAGQERLKERGFAEGQLIQGISTETLPYKGKIRIDEDTGQELLVTEEGKEIPIEGGEWSALSIESAPTGKQEKAQTEAGTEIDFQYKLVEAPDLIASHLLDFSLNPLFPESKQPRDRSRMASKLQIEGIRNRLAPARLGANPLASEGAPIVDSEGIVESGNARVMALKSAIDIAPGTYTGYKTWLEENAEQFGFKREDVADMTQPLLVRERTTEMEPADIKKFVDEANAPSVAIMGATEKAMADAERITPELLGSFQPTEEGNIDTPGNADFIRTFFNLLAPTERAQYIDEGGEVNQDGLRRIRNALFAKAYGDPKAVKDLAESTDNNVRNIMNAMVALSPRFVELRQKIADGTRYDMDISTDIAAAARKISFLRKQGESIENYLRQVELLGEEISPVAKELLRIFNIHKRSGKRIIHFLNNYLELVHKRGTPQQVDLLGAGPDVSSNDYIAAALMNMEEENGLKASDDQAGLFEDEGREGEVAIKQPQEKPPAKEAEKPTEEPKEPAEAAVEPQEAPQPPLVAKKGAPQAQKPKGANLAFIPRHLQEPVDSPQFEQEYAKIVKRSDIVSKLQTDLGVPIRNGRFKGKAWAIYKAGRQIIRWKHINSVFHEVGHYLSETMPKVWKEKVPQVEIDPLLEEYGGKPKNRKDEAWSQFLFYWVTNPAKARAKAPQFSNYFKQTIKKYPEIESVLKTARADFQRWRSQSPTAKVLSQVSMRDQKGRLRHRVANKVEDMYANVLDDLLPLKQAIDRLKAEGIEIPDEENFYKMLRVHRGVISKTNVALEKGTINRVFWTKRGGRQTVVFKGKSYQDIVRPIAKANKLQDFTAYLVARRVVELTGRDKLTGVSLEDAQAVIREQEQKNPNFAQAAQELYKFQDDILDYGKQSGLYDDATLAEMKELNQQYVPFYRVIEGMERAGMMGKSASDVSRVIKRIKGSELDIINPLESIIRNTYAIMNAADRNMAGVMMANLAEQNVEFGKLFEFIPTPQAKVASVKLEDLGINAEKLFGEEDIDDERMAIFDRVFDIFRPSSFTPADNVAAVWIEGKKRYYQVDPAIYKAMSAMDAESTAWVIKALSYPTRLLRAGAILTPEFMARNPARDTVSAYIYSQYGFMPIRDNIKAVSALLGKTDEYWLWRLGGGDHSMMVSLDRKYLTKTFDQVVGQHKFKNYVKSPLEVLRIGSEFSEKLNRLPEAILALRAGKSPIEAGFASREVTLDFSKGGHVGRSLNSIIAFWKAWALGWEKMIISFKDRPTQTAAKVAMGITLPSIGLWMINHDDPRWKKIPQWQKDLFWIILTKRVSPEQWAKMTPEQKTKHMSQTVIRIPKPFEPGILFGSTVERFLDYLESKDPQGMKQLAKNLFWTQAPGIFPTGLLPLWENASNWSQFYQRPIVPQYRTGLPPEAQYTAFTSEAAKKIGGILKYPPAKIDNLIRGYFAGLGRHATAAVDEILVATGIAPHQIKPTKTLADVPLARAFIVRRPSGSASEPVNRFYSEMERLNAGEKYLKELLVKNNRERFYEFKAENPELLFTLDWTAIPEGKGAQISNYYSMTARQMRRTSYRLADLRRKQRAVWESTTMTPEQKRVTLDRIDDVITELAEKSLDWFNGVRREAEKIDSKK